MRTAALVALGAVRPAVAGHGPRAGLLHLAAVAAAWSYNARLKATALSFLPYALAFGAVPSIVVLALPGAALAPAWATRGGCAAGCRRPPVQRAARPRGGPRAGRARAAAPPGRPARSAAWAAVLLLTAAVLLAVGPPGPAGPPRVLAPWALSVVVTAVGLVRSRREGSRDAFLAALVVAALSVGLLVARGAVLVAA